MEPLFTRLRLPYGKEVKDLSVVRRQHLLLSPHTLTAGGSETPGRLLSDLLYLISCNHEAGSLTA